MEEKFVYMTPEKVEERRAKVAAIEGLAELRAAIKNRSNYFVAKMQFERGEIDFEAVPVYRSGEVQELEKKYPRASAYLEAERWIHSGNPVKVRLAARAMEKLLEGEDPEAVILGMSKGLDAFYLAQQGD